MNTESLQSHPVPRSRSLEFYLWLFTRLSGVLFLLVAAFGIVYASLVGRSMMDAATQYRWAFFPIYWHVLNSDVPELVPAWSNVGWRVLEMLVLALAAGHGFNGLRVISEDYLHNPTLRRIALVVILALFLLVLFAAAVIIFEIF